MSVADYTEDLIAQGFSREDAEKASPGAGLWASVKVGDKLYEPNGRLWHVRGRVDEQVILRTWSEGKQRWRYSCEPIEAFIVGMFRRTKKTPNGTENDRMT